MPKKKNSGAWPSNPAPEQKTPNNPEGTVDVDDRDEGYLVSGGDAAVDGPAGSDYAGDADTLAGDDDDSMAAEGDDEDTLDIEEDTEDESGGYTASEQPRVHPQSPDAKKRP